MAAVCRRVQILFTAMRERSFAFLRLRAAKERFLENRYEPRRPELWAEVEYWSWRVDNAPR